MCLGIPFSLDRPVCEMLCRHRRAGVFCLRSRVSRALKGWDETAVHARVLSTLLKRQSLRGLATCVFALR